MAEPVVVAVSGVKNSGKTTLIEGLIPLLCARGLKVAVIKHDGHDFSPDVPGTDTCRHLNAGACGTAVFSAHKWMACKQGAVDETALMALFPDADLILLEGFKHSAWPKLELVREGNSAESVCEPTTLLAMVSALPLKAAVPVLHPDALEDIAGLLYRYYLERSSRHA